MRVESHDPAVLGFLRPLLICIPAAAAHEDYGSEQYGHNPANHSQCA